MTAFFPCFEDPEVSDETTEAMRAQLRAMYRWIPKAQPGEANIEIVCREKRPAPVLAKHVKAAAAELQESITLRSQQDAARALVRRGFFPAMGYGG